MLQTIYFISLKMWYEKKNAALAEKHSPIVSHFQEVQIARLIHVKYKDINTSLVY